MGLEGLLDPAKRAEKEKLFLLRKLILPELLGGLWHTTHPDRFAQIVKSGVILPEPDLPASDRWKTKAGPHWYPYVRTLGGISLFDFEAFEPETYGEKCPMSSWYEFVPYRECWGCAVWIEIDREQAASKYISGSDLVERWKAEKAFEHTIMPYIEAAYLGPLPVVTFKRAFLVEKENSEFQPVYP